MSFQTQDDLHFIKCYALDLHIWMVWTQIICQQARKLLNRWWDHLKYIYKHLWIHIRAHWDTFLNFISSSAFSCLLFHTIWRIWNFRFERNQKKIHKKHRYGVHSSQNIHELYIYPCVYLCIKNNLQMVIPQKRAYI